MLALVSSYITTWQNLNGTFILSQPTRQDRRQRSRNDLGLKSWRCNLCLHHEHSDRCAFNILLNTHTHTRSATLTISIQPKVCLPSRTVDPLKVVADPQTAASFFCNSYLFSKLKKNKFVYVSSVINYKKKKRNFDFTFRQLLVKESLWAQNCLQIWSFSVVAVLDGLNVYWNSGPGLSKVFYRWKNNHSYYSVQRDLSTYFLLNRGAIWDSWQ